MTQFGACSSPIIFKELTSQLKLYLVVLAVTLVIVTVCLQQMQLCKAILYSVDEYFYIVL